jgi:hypothetical protein
LILQQLTVGADLPTPQTLLSLNIDTTGSAGDNQILDASTIGASINVTGATHLTLGALPTAPVAGDAYTFAAGTIDATMATGGVAASVEPTSLTAQTFDMGTGANIANVFRASPTDAGGGVINFAGGGTDTVEFHAFQDTDSLLNDNVAGGHNYNNVVGFTNASGTVNLSTGSFVVPSPSQTASGIQLQRVPRRWRPTSAASAKTFQPHTPTTSISTSNRALPGTRR